MSVRETLFAGSMLMIGGMAFAADDELPDTAFLEYLGSWEESDEDWLMFEKNPIRPERKRDDTESQDDESAETNDED